MIRMQRTMSWMSQIDLNRFIKGETGPGSVTRARVLLEPKKTRARAYTPGAINLSNLWMQ